MHHGAIESTRPCAVKSLAYEQLKEGQGRAYQMGVKTDRMALGKDQ